MLTFFLVTFTLIYLFYHTICFLYGLCIEISESIFLYIIDLKIFLYLPTTIRKRLQNIKPCCFSSDWQSVLQHAIQNNHVKCLKKAFKNGCEWNSDVCNILMLLNHREGLLFAHSNECEWDWCTCDSVDDNFYDCVENGLNMITDTETDICDKLAVLNNEKCLLFAHINGHDWDWCTCDEVDGDVNTCVKNGLYKIHVLPTLLV